MEKSHPHSNLQGSTTTTTTYATESITTQPPNLTCNPNQIYPSNNSNSHHAPLADQHPQLQQTAETPGGSSEAPGKALHLNTNVNMDMSTHTNNYPHKIDGPGGPTATAPFLRDFSLVAEAAKRAQMSVMMRDLESVTL
ncbi:hypothetical protein EYZ11_012437 [Aspergillus tanneri]|uniref:Uncharacterized protein n=1 Tax=Aspergillus tanneri TaxID=1220188 RepID=A0A4V3UMP7_9EURO|nr:uncharacterized protein ATNIH1004_007946 [Aspergillus tanneri]KAA8646513.1 hypothetical protein ATNIH1004_007946 [Aspergillus tanneri]THC88114.1 hypothetical protein EYZ11_012437 [Aspergillus tanneri]